MSHIDYSDYPVTKIFSGPFNNPTEQLSDLPEWCVRQTGGVWELNRRVSGQRTENHGENPFFSLCCESAEIWAGNESDPILPHHNLHSTKDRDVKTELYRSNKFKPIQHSSTWCLIWNISRDQMSGIKPQSADWWQLGQVSIMLTFLRVKVSCLLPTAVSLRFSIPELCSRWSRSSRDVLSESNSSSLRNWAK